jgi:hypothetical protein
VSVAIALLISDAVHQKVLGNLIIVSLGKSKREIPDAVVSIAPTRDMFALEASDMRSPF